MSFRTNHVLFACSLMLFASESFAQQCPGTHSFPIDARGRPSARGTQCWVPNEAAGHVGFSAARTVRGQSYQGRIPLADPAITKIGDHFYVTGTSDEHATSNFPVYRSRNLVNWEYFGTFFSEANVDPQQPWIIRLNGRGFCNLWAPEFVLDPARPDRIALTFTATEDTELGICSNGFTPPNLPNGVVSHNRPSWDLTSSFVAVTTMSAFLSQLPAAAPESGHPLWSEQPQSFGYRLNGNSQGPLIQDGGRAQFAASGIWKVIPTTTNIFNFSWTDAGGFYFNDNGARLCVNGMGCNANIGIDPGVFFDPQNSNRPWLVYTWLDGSQTNGWGGLHTAAYPLRFLQPSDEPRDRITLLEPFGNDRQHLPLAFRINNNNSIQIDRRKTMPNGSLGRFFVDYNTNAVGGVGEGGNIFYWGGRYYLTISRNGWDSPAYGIYYRRSTHLAGLAMPSWDSRNAPEQTLAVSRNRTEPCGESFGHGMMFVGPGGRPFMIFHKKDKAVSNCFGDQPVYPNGFPRTIYFKELTVNARNGDLQSFSQTDRNGRGGDIRGFVVPR